MADNEMDLMSDEPGGNMLVAYGLELLSVFLDYFMERAKEKIPEITDKAIQKFESFFSNPETKQEIISEWSKQLYEKGLIGSAEIGLSDNLLVHNFLQEGYMSGLWVGYVMAMMSLVDNSASEELIRSVQDSMRPNLMGQIYENSTEFFDKYKDEKYIWLEAIADKDGGQDNG